MSGKRLQVLITAPQQAELAETDFSDADLAGDEIVGRTLVTLISAGTELGGHYAATTNFPRQPGYTAVFEVERVGAEVADLKPGDRVFSMAPHASRQRRKRPEVIPVPGDLPSEKALCARMMCVSMSTLTTTTARPPEPVAVTGLGPVGHFAAQIFQSCGYEVLAVDPIEARRRDAQAMGIRNVAERLPRKKEEPLFGTFALVLECSGHEQAVVDACKAVRKRGEVVLVGVPWSKRSDLSAFDVLHPVFHKYAVLRSGWEWELPNNPSDFRVNSIMGNIAVAMRWLAEGRIKTDGLYELRSPRDAQQCYQDLLQRRSAKLLTLFDWNKV
jgi:threonine dehydrogenase-like Zn-dependent dehydrogenase